METERDRAALRVFWWQGGLHIEPQTDEQRALLVGLWQLLRDGVRIDHEVISGPIDRIQRDYEKSVDNVDHGL